jgi:hypothetical protein
MHSTFSDGKLTIPQLVDLFGQQGFGAIAITDHLCETSTVIGKAAGYLGHTLTRESFPRYLEILKEEGERAWRQYRMVVIPGFELTKNSVFNHRSAHVLGLGISDYIPADGDPKSLARAIRAQGGVAIAAHPVSTRKFEKQTYQLWDHRVELEKEFDAWEVASGPYLFHEVLRSSFPLVASSDLHHPNQLSSWKTIFTCEKSIPAILDAIRKQDLEFRYYDSKAPARPNELLMRGFAGEKFNEIGKLHARF